MERARFIVCLFSTALAFGADSGKALRPRLDQTQYAVAVFDESLAVAAELVPAHQVRKQFGPEVDSDYLVVEVGIYPRDRRPIEVRQVDFNLRVNRTRDILTPQGPKAILEVRESLRPVALELSAKSLPETSAYKPVAGYLYFAVSDKREGNYEYELEYKGHGAWMILPLQQASRR